MRILAVDPGTTQSAFVTWNGTALVDEYGLVTNDALLAYLHRLRPLPVVVLEQIESFGMPVGREVFTTVKWCGRFIEACEQGGGRWAEVPRRQVKLHICGHARATDANIRQALIDRIGPIGTKKSPGPLHGLKGHEFQALAVAVTYYDLNNDIRTVETSRRV